MARPILQLEASNEEVAELGRLVRGSKVSVRDRFRANIILRRLEGKSETEVAQALGCSLGAVCKWSKRFDAQGITGLKDAPGRGRKERLPTEKISLVLERATRPPQGRVRWSIRSMAREAGVSKSTVQRIWHHNDIKPHRLETFKISSRCGLMSLWCQMRCTVLLLTPASRAIERILHLTRPCGGLVARSKTREIFSVGSRSLRPLPGASLRPVIP